MARSVKYVKKILNYFGSGKHKYIYPAKKVSKRLSVPGERLYRMRKAEKYRSKRAASLRELPVHLQKSSPFKQKQYRERVAHAIQRAEKQGGKITQLKRGLEKRYMETIIKNKPTQLEIGSKTDMFGIRRRPFKITK